MDLLYQDCERFFGATLEAALAWWLVWLMRDELSVAVAGEVAGTAVVAASWR